MNMPLDGSPLWFDKARGRHKSIQIIERKVKLSVFSDSIITYIENPKGYPKNCFN